MISPIHFIQEKCTDCGLCEPDCPAMAISIAEATISSSCIACGHCVAICPHGAMQFNNNDVTKLPQQSVEPEDFEALAKHVRSVRKFTDKDVSEKDIENIVELLAQCPSASNNRNVEITVVTDKNKIREIERVTSDTLYSFFTLLTRPILKPLLRLFIRSKEIEKLQYYAQTFDKKRAQNKEFITFNAPAVILFHAPKLPTQSSCADAHIWATYTSLYAKTRNLGTCFNGFIEQAAKRTKKIHSVCEINPAHEISCVLLMGHPAVKYTHEVSREKPKVNSV
ncbi:MAG: nitroreductase family protein [Bacteroidales bacterium]